MIETNEKTETIQQVIQREIGSFKDEDQVTVKAFLESREALRIELYFAANDRPFARILTNLSPTQRMRADLVLAYRRDRGLMRLLAGHLFTRTDLEGRTRQHPGGHDRLRDLRRCGLYGQHSNRSMS